MIVFVSAAPSARARSLPNLITGFEAEIKDGAKELFLVATLDPAFQNDPPSSASAPAGTDRLVARPTGKTYKNLPWWEAVLEG